MAATLLLWLAAISLTAWCWLLVFRGTFWRAMPRLEASGDEPSSWPGVVAVIPARNEAESIATTISSLFSQDYPGRLAVVVVDDDSDDGTAEIAIAAAGDRDSFALVKGEPLAAGWTGKLWALAQGIRKAEEMVPEAAYILLTDADIQHGASGLRRLVAKAERESLVLASLMVKLRCRSFWELLLVPAFIFFFQKLYPFSWVNDPTRRTAAAAGGCMLVRRDGLQRSGGVEGIRNELIDDCALARQMKKTGPIWLGLAVDTESLRAYEHLGEIWRMVARTAFVQLRHSFLYLLGTVAGMAVLYLVPAVATITGLVQAETGVFVLGAVAWATMAFCYAPTLRIYNLPVSWALSLPVAGVLYTVFTLDSARRHWLGRGGYWKGRTHRADGTRIG